MIETVGDRAWITRRNEIVLAGERGPIASFDLDIGDEAGGQGELPGAIAASVVLADPPRIALLRRSDDGGIVEILDPMTARVHLRVDAPVDSLIGFSPRGDLWVNARRGLALVDETGALHLVHRAARTPVFEMVFARHGRRALARSVLVAEPRIQLIDVDDGTGDATTTWARDVDAGAMCVDADCSHAALVVDSGDGPLELERWDLERGERTDLLFALDHGASTLLRGIAATPDLARVVGVARSGNLYVDDSLDTRAQRAVIHARDGLGRDVLVHGPSMRSLAASEAGALLRDLLADARDVRGRIIATVAGASRLCFAGTGTATALIGGAVHTIDGEGAHLVEGPAALIDIAPHPRGVLVVDDDDRALTIEL